MQCVNNTVNYVSLTIKPLFDLQFIRLSHILLTYIIIPTGHHAILLPARKNPPTVDRFVRTIACKRRR